MFASIAADPFGPLPPGKEVDSRFDASKPPATTNPRVVVQPPWLAGRDMTPEQFNEHFFEIQAIELKYRLAMHKFTENTKRVTAPQTHLNEDLIVCVLAHNNRIADDLYAAHIERGLAYARLELPCLRIYDENTHAFSDYYRMLDLDWVVESTLLTTEK